MSALAPFGSTKVCPKCGSDALLRQHAPGFWVFRRERMLVCCIKCLAIVREQTADQTTPTVTP